MKKLFLLTFLACVLFASQVFAGPENVTIWVDAPFYDYDGGVTPQTSENIATDKWYYCWFNPAMNAPYVRMSIDSVFTDVNDIAKVMAYMVGTK